MSSSLCSSLDDRVPHHHMMTSSNGNIFRVTGPLCGNPVNSSHKGEWRGALVFSLICFSINGWINNREAGDLRRHRGHYDMNIMKWVTVTELKVRVPRFLFHMMSKSVACPIIILHSHGATCLLVGGYLIRSTGHMWNPGQSPRQTCVRLQNLPWYKTGFVSR